MCSKRGHAAASRFFRPTVLDVFDLSNAELGDIFAVYGIRGVYFALIEETKIASNVTGTAVGLISVIGFTPDIFFAPIAGRIIDASPGVAGFQNYFLRLSGFAVMGMLASLMLARYKTDANVRAR